MFYPLLSHSLYLNLNSLKTLNEQKVSCFNITKSSCCAMKCKFIEKYDISLRRHKSPLLIINKNILKSNYNLFCAYLHSNDIWNIKEFCLVKVSKKQ
jgi:hypothetical protein